MKNLIAMLPKQMCLNNTDKNAEIIKSKTSEDVEHYSHFVHTEEV